MFSNLILVRLRLQKSSTLQSVSRNEIQTSETKCAEDCWSNYPIPTCRDWELSR